MKADEIKQAIQSRYAKFADSGGKPEFSSASGKKRADLLSTTHLYTEKELAMVPQRVCLLFQGCGNLTDAVALQPGDSVVDPGCGGGLRAAWGGRAAPGPGRSRAAGRETGSRNTVGDQAAIELLSLK